MCSDIFFLENNLTIPYKITSENLFLFCEAVSCYTILADLCLQSIRIKGVHYQSGIQHFGSFTICQFKY